MGNNNNNRAAQNLVANNPQATTVVLQDDVVEAGYLEKLAVKSSITRLKGPPLPICLCTKCRLDRWLSLIVTSAQRNCALCRYLKYRYKPGTECNCILAARIDAARVQRTVRIERLSAKPTGIARMSGKTFEFNSAICTAFYLSRSGIARKKQNFRGDLSIQTYLEGET